MSEPPTLTILDATLRINDVLYTATRDEHKTYLAYFIRKKEGKGEQYECREYKDGRQECTCKDATYRGRSGCKHVAALRLLGAFESPIEPAAPPVPDFEEEPEDIFIPL